MARSYEFGAIAHGKENICSHIFWLMSKRNTHGIRQQT
jgi:hypothetical protein